MKYVTLIRGNEKIIYPVFELQKTSFFDGGNNTRVDVQTTHGYPSVPGPYAYGFFNNVDIHNMFVDEIPTATSYGSITQTDFLFKLDTASQKQYCPEAKFLTIPVGEKPDDWDTNWFDYYTYQTGQVGNWGNVPVAVYPITNPREVPEWNSEAQYYKNNTYDLHERFNHLFFTDAGYSFGIWTCAGQGEGTLAYNKYTYPGILPREMAVVDSSSNCYYWRDPNGSVLNFGTAEQNPSIRIAYLHNNVMDLIPSVSLTSHRQDVTAFAYIEHNDKIYYGIIAICFETDGTPINCRFLGFTEDFWGEGSITDIEPEYEVEEGPTTPSRAGGQGTFTSVTINRGDSAGQYVNERTMARESQLAKAFNNYFSKVYCFDNVNDSVLGAIFGELYGENYWDLFKNLQLNPLSAILNFHLIPASLRGANLTLENLVIGPKDFTHDSDGSIPQVITCKTIRWYHVGTIDVSNVFTHYFDGFPDFEPYTKATLHLPFIGDISIDINAVMYGTLSVDYVCDNINGNVAAWIWCEDKDGKSTYKYVATGNCSYSIPLWSQSQNGLDVGKIIGSGIGLVGGAVTGNPTAIVGGAMGIGSTLYQQSREPIHTQHTGGASGNVSFLGDHVCWLEVVRPQWINVDDENDKPYKHGEGLPAIMKGTIASNYLKNHVSVSWVDLTNIVAATPEELAEIESMLKSGILINEE